MARAGGGGLPFDSRAAILAMLGGGIIAAHAEAALYAVSPWGPAEPYIRRAGWVGTYAPLLRPAPADR